MLILLSPAKSLDYASTQVKASSRACFETQASELVALLQQLGLPKLKSLLGVSDQIARLNLQRYQDWEEQPEKQAVLAFDGPAYRGLGAHSLTSEQLEFAQRHLRILCGLYGLLRPLDVIKPYRLDMGKKLANERGKDLYAFWSSTVTQALRSELEDMPEEERFVVNCASQEYFKAVNMAELGFPVYNMCFPGPSVYAKQARGAMVRFIVQQRVSTPERLQHFTGNDGEWHYDSKKSSGFDLVFVRSAAAAKKRSGAAAPDMDTAAPAAADSKQASSKQKPAAQQQNNSRAPKRTKR